MKFLSPNIESQKQEPSESKTAESKQKISRRQSEEAKQDLRKFFHLRAAQADGPTALNSSKKGARGVVTCHGPAGSQLFEQGGVTFSRFTNNKGGQTATRSDSNLGRRAMKNLFSKQFAPEVRLTGPDCKFRSLLHGSGQVYKQSRQENKTSRFNPEAT